MSDLMIFAVAILLCILTADSAPRKPRLTLAEPMPSYYHTDIGGDSGAYSFGYDVFDPVTGNTQYRNEERYPNGTVVGTYGYIDPLGEARVFRYISDERGYRVTSERNVNKINDIHANLESTTESSVTWTRPSKKKSQQNRGHNSFLRRNYNSVQPPGYYILY